MDNPGFEEKDDSPSPTLPKSSLSTSSLSTSLSSISKSKLEEEEKNNNVENGQSEEKRKREKKMILKTIIIISFAFMLLFTAFQSMASLQSSINKVMGFSKMHFVLTLLITIKISGKNKT